MYKIEDFKTLAPMKYYDNPEPKTDTFAAKRQAIVDNTSGEYIATKK